MKSFNNAKEKTLPFVFFLTLLKFKRDWDLFASETEQWALIYLKEQWGLLFMKLWWSVLFSCSRWFQRAILYFVGPKSLSSIHHHHLQLQPTSLHYPIVSKVYPLVNISIKISCFWLYLLLSNLPLHYLLVEIKKKKLSKFALICWVFFREN